MSRKQKGLFLLAHRFYRHAESNGVVFVTETAELLGVPRRRIYDILAILTVIGVMKKIQANVYQWIGRTAYWPVQQGGTIRSLTSMCAHVMNLFRERKIVTIEELNLLGKDRSDRRKLYDVVNVLHGVGLLSVPYRGVYCFQSTK